ncbi:MAG: hypothetical protein EBY73_07550 [Burkholderiaceae bacterium]|nr:hypothetical protein [Burkholderiaceae bacterium]
MALTDATSSQSSMRRWARALSNIGKFTPANTCTFWGFANRIAIRDADDVPKQRPDHKKDSAQSISQLHQTIAKENFDQILLATQETGGQKKLKSYQKKSLYLILVILGAGAVFSFYARADIVGFMPAYGERLVITSETCKWENGREEPNWLFAYFESSFGNVTRACYVRYNNQIWLRKSSGVEMVFPADYFTKPANNPEPPKN